MIEFEGEGWIQVSALNMRADAHCPGHDDGVHCKMDGRREYSRGAAAALTCGASVDVS